MSCNDFKIHIDAWSKIWSYFADEQCQHSRRFTTDFEFYKSESEVEVHIAVD